MHPALQAEKRALQLQIDELQEKLSKQADIPNSHNSLLSRSSGLHCTANVETPNRQSLLFPLLPLLNRVSRNTPTYHGSHTDGFPINSGPLTSFPLTLVILLSHSNTARLG